MISLNKLSEYSQVVFPGTDGRQETDHSLSLQLDPDLVQDHHHEAVTRHGDRNGNAHAFLLMAPFLSMVPTMPHYHLAYQE